MNHAQLQFHWMRLGNRPDVAKLFGFSKVRMAALLPETDQQRYMRGRMVKVGGILAKRCVRCGTAREVDRFYVDEDRASGCRAVCDICREAAGVIPQREPYLGHRATAKLPGPNGTGTPVRPCSPPS